MQKLHKTLLYFTHKKTVPVDPSHPSDVCDAHPCPESEAKSIIECTKFLFYFLPNFD